MRRLTLALAGATLAAAPARAQDSVRVGDTARAASETARPFVITPAVGLLLHDQHSALRRTSPAFGLDFVYRLNSRFGIGLTGTVSRPETDGSYFPLVRIPAGDTSYYYRVSQRVVEYMYGVHGTATIPLGRFSPYAVGSLGRYTFTMDPQAVGGTRRASGPMLALGAGISFPVGRGTGITVDLRDVVLADFERGEFDATDPLLWDPERFDPVPGGKPAPRSTVHTLRLTIGLSFVPADDEEEAR